METVTYERIAPGMRIRPAWTDGPFREVEEIERIGRRVIIGYADDPVFCGRYRDSERFEVAPEPGA